MWQNAKPKTVWKNPKPKNICVAIKKTKKSFVSIYETIKNTKPKKNLRQNTKPGGI